MPGSKEKDFKGKMHFPYLTYLWPHPSKKNPAPRGHEVYNFDKPFFGHHYYTLNLSESCP